MATALLNTDPHTTVSLLPVESIRPSEFSVGIYGDPSGELGNLLESVREHGVLVPLVVVRRGSVWELVSGHRRLACAHELGFREVPCQVRSYPDAETRRRAILDYNRHRNKTFSQSMREADAFELLVSAEARARSAANLRQHTQQPADCADRRNSDSRAGRTDEVVARALGIGGKDLYRQARAIWAAAKSEDHRALSAVAQLDAGTKTIHAAYKDLRRRDRFTTGFRPTPYDVWAFRHDRAFGIPHPGSIPPAIVAHTLHYFTAPGALVVDPMAGGGTTLDVCQSMGRRCLAYDLHPTRPDILENDIRNGLPREALGCDLLFCDPPYHTMLAGRYGTAGAGDVPFSHWLEFLKGLAAVGWQSLKPGGFITLLIASQTEKDLPAGFGYIDHAFYSYQTLTAAGFMPERRVSCPMDGAYLPQHVTRARAEGRMLGQVRDLLVMRKP